MIGGTVSTLSGGKFANGAATAAFAQAFNEEIHRAEEAVRKNAKDPPQTTEERVAIVRVRRITETKQSTIGELTIDGTDVSGYTLEPPGPSSTIENSGKRISAGEYDLVPFSSAKHPDVFEVANVPGRSAILIHTGNLPEHTAGCLLPGTSTTPNAVWNSGEMLNTLRTTLQDYGRMRIIISDDFK
jgi:hypothetical protein